MENQREIVLDILLTLEKGEEFSHRLLKAVLDKYDYMEGRDKAFIKRLTEGTLERQLELDYYLNQFSTVPVKKMKPLIRCLLRMSTYQILYMDNVPDRASCNEACKLAGRRKFQNLKGFVNGILRNISKNKDCLSLPDVEKEPTQYLSIKYSMPEWLVKFWMENYAFEGTEKILKGLLEIHPVSLRFRLSLSADERKTYVQKIQQKGGILTQSAYLPYLYTISGVEGIKELPGFLEGVFTIQDVSSALSVEAAGIGPHDYVMDLCAAPGGKSILAAERAKQVLSRDVSEYKTSLILENIERMQIKNVTVQVFDATNWDETQREKADVVIMDVPCSGLGVIGKKRDIKYHVTLERLKELQMLQKSIVDRGWQYVKPGGILLYSTCTINPMENEEMVRYIVGQYPFEPESIEAYVPSELLAIRDEIREKQRTEIHKEALEQGYGVRLTEKEASCCIQLLPGFMKTDGFFFARFRRKLS